MTNEAERVFTVPASLTLKIVYVYYFILKLKSPCGRYTKSLKAFDMSMLSLFQAPVHAEIVAPNIQQFVYIGIGCFSFYTTQAGNEKLDCAAVG